MIALIGLGILLTVGISFVIRRIIKSEKRRIKYEPNMKPGDKVVVPISDNAFAGEVHEINGDTVKIIVTTPKSKVYPI